MEESLIRLIVNKSNRATQRGIRTLSVFESYFCTPRSNILFILIYLFFVRDLARFLRIFSYFLGVLQKLHIHSTPSLLASHRVYLLYAFISFFHREARSRANFERSFLSCQERQFFSEKNICDGPTVCNGLYSFCQLPIRYAFIASRLMFITELLNIERGPLTNVRGKKRYIGEYRLIISKYKKYQNITNVKKSDVCT